MAKRVSAKPKPVQKNVRFPPALLARITEEAKKHGVSFNQEMVRRLEASFTVPADISFSKEVINQLAIHVGRPDLVMPIKRDSEN